MKPFLLRHIVPLLTIPLAPVLFWAEQGIAAPAKTAKPPVQSQAKPVPASKPAPPSASSLLYVAVLPAPTLEAPQAKLANGALLVTSSSRLAPRVAMSLLFKAGAADETPQIAGWRRLLTDAMLRANLDEKGNPQENRAIAREAEELGGRAGATVGDDQIEFWAEGDSATQDKLLDLLLRMALRPRLAEGDVDASRQRLLSRLELESQDVPSQAINSLRDRLYHDTAGEATVYGLPGNGMESSLKTLDATRLRLLHATFFQPSFLVASFAGDVNVAAVRERLEKLEKPAVPEGTPLVKPGSVPRLEPPSKDQPPLVVRQLPMGEMISTAWLFAGYPLPGADSPDTPALRVLSAALGEMPRSRLERRLLGASLIPGLDDSAVLQAASQWTPRRWSGELVVFAQTRGGDLENAKNALLDEVSRLRDVPLTQPEIERAKNYLRGSWAVDRESLRDRAFQTGLAPAIGGTGPQLSDTHWPARLDKVTAADVRRVAAKYLQNYAVTLIMPEE